MNRSEIEAQIRSNLGVYGESADLRLQPDTSGRWRLSLISPAFEHLPQGRRIYALKGLEERVFESAEFLSPDERAWAGSIIQNSDLSKLPLWSDAVLRSGVEAESILFPSDLDSDLRAPFRVTFYSVRGGVGRSTALTYTARILASKGFKVVCLDLDLEAPGLAALFGVDSHVTSGKGIVHLLNEFDRGEHPDVSSHLIRISESDELYCLPAGKPDADYIRLLPFISPSSWYTEERNPLTELIEAVSTKLPFLPDVLLFDSRTGISEISAPLLFDLCDLAVLTFFPHPQVKEAMGELTRTLLAAKTARTLEGKKLTPEPRFLVSPVPASRSSEIAQKYRSRANDWITEWLSATNMQQADLETVIDSTHLVGYRESTATSDSSLANTEVWADYSPVSEWIEKYLPSPFETKALPLESDKQQILRELSFASGLAEQQGDLLETFVEVSTTRKALDLSVPLVLGRKGVGKTAIFRWLSERSDVPVVQVTAPVLLAAGKPWIFASEAFAAAEDILRLTQAGWRTFWRFLIVIATRYGPNGLPKLEALGDQVLPEHLSTSSSVLNLFEAVLTQPRAELMLSDAVNELDSIATGRFLLLFDGLDTGFGSSSADRARRRRALEGLAEVTLERMFSVRLHMKLLLREDIWRQLRVENKSHFYGHYVVLEWRDQASYYKVVVKQALRSPRFQQLVRQTVPLVNFDAVNDWTEREVTSVWNTLVGERMQGGNTAKTRNWVWNRLADANDDHSPRYLLQLFKEVLAFENEEQRRSPYERSVLRPRGLSIALPKVSKEALQALSTEEFPELDRFLQRLTEIGRTPFSGEEVSAFPEDLNLAREVGLVGVYEGTEEKVERFRIPEIYRYALNMTRRGQV